MSHTETRPSNTPKDASKVDSSAEIDIVQNGIRHTTTAGALRGLDSNLGSRVAMVAEVVVNAAASIRTATFPVGSFTSAPVVTATPLGSAGTENLSVTIYNVTAADFDYRVTDDLGADVGATIHYIACGAAV